MLNKILFKNVIPYLSFLDIVKLHGHFDWFYDIENIIKFKFKEDQEKGLWKNFSYLRTFNNRVCSCKCQCSSSDSDSDSDYDSDYDEYNSQRRVPFNECKKNICQCYCSYIGEKLSENDYKFIAQIMKDIGNVKLSYNDIIDSTFPLTHFLIHDLFKLSETDIAQLKKEYDELLIKVYAQTWNMFQIMNGSALPSFSN